MPKGLENFTDDEILDKSPANPHDPKVPKNTEADWDGKLYLMITQFAESAI